MSTRNLIEDITFDPKTVTVDEQNHVIRNVRVLGGQSKNRYVPESEGTEYTDPCMKSALPLYENVTVYGDHPDRSRVTAERSVDDAIGKIRNVRHQPGEIRGDLHYRPSSPIAQALVDDVKLGLGMYALSHNAASDRERYDKTKRKLLIESIALVRSVDVVTRGATSRTLAESEMQTETKPKITFRGLLESDRKRFSQRRQSWMTRLLEMDAMDSPMSATTDVETDPDEALKGGFKAAILAVVEQSLSGDMSAADGLKKIKELLTTHEKINGDADPEDPPADEPDGDEEVKMESLQAEIVQLKAREKIRSLCEAEKFIPSKTQIKALVLLESDTERMELITSWKSLPPVAVTGSKPRSVAPGAIGPRNTLESQQPPTPTPVKASDALNLLRS